MYDYFCLLMKRNIEFCQGLVSIIMPLYNYGQFLEDAILSVKAQTYKSWELIIVDDCSTDDSFEVAKRLTLDDSRIRVVRLEKNSGTAGARNYGLDLALGEFAAFLDSDDMYDPNYLESQIEMLKDTGKEIVVAGYRRLAPNSKTDFYVPKLITYKLILKGNPIAPLGILFKRTPFKDLRFDLSMRKCEDYVFFMQMLKRVDFAAGNQKILGTLRIHAGSKSRKKLTLIKWQYLSYRKMGLPIISSFYYVVRWALYGIKKYKNVK